MPGERLIRNVYKTKLEGTTGLVYPRVNPENMARRYKSKDWLKIKKLGRAESPPILQSNTSR